MDEAIVKEIKSFIERMKSDRVALEIAISSIKNMRKSSYAEGYSAALDDVKHIINFAESLKTN